MEKERGREKRGVMVADLGQRASCICGQEWAGGGRWAGSTVFGHLRGTLEYGMLPITNTDVLRRENPTRLPLRAK